MTLYTQRPTFISLRFTVLPEAKSHLVDWQADLNGLLTSQPGFVSLEFLSHPDLENSWTMVERFDDAKNASNWKTSSTNQTLLKRLQSMTSGEIQESTASESHLQGGVTEVIVTEVNPGKERAFRAWSSKIHKLEAQFPGFRGVYVQAPSSRKKNHWITLLQFDTPEHLDFWLSSKERENLLAESEDTIATFENHRVVSPFAGWFASIAETVGMPPLWKQTMLVLLVLFPIVMMELRYLSPLTEGLGLSLSTFLGNALSVSLISFPMMPLALYLLGWWLSPPEKNSRAIHFVGTLLVIIFYMIEIAFFWKF